MKKLIYFFKLLLTFFTNATAPKTLFEKMVQPKKTKTKMKLITLMNMMRAFYHVVNGRIDGINREIKKAMKMVKTEKKTHMLNSLSMKTAKKELIIVLNLQCHTIS